MTLKIKMFQSFVALMIILVGVKKVKVHFWSTQWSNLYSWNKIYYDLNSNFPAKIEMAFSQMLAIRSWSKELQ